MYNRVIIVIKLIFKSILDILTFWYCIDAKKYEIKIFTFSTFLIKIV